MSATAFHQIAQAVKAALLQSPALASGRVDLPRRHPVPAEWSEYIEVSVATSDGTWPYVGAGTPGQWQSAVTVDIYARAAAGQQPHDRLDDLLAATALRLSTLDLAALGAVDVLPNVRIDWDWADGAEPMEKVAYQFVVRHDTRTAGLAP